MSQPPLDPAIRKAALEHFVKPLAHGIAQDLIRGVSCETIAELLEREILERMGERLSAILREHEEQAAPRKVIDPA